MNYFHDINFINVDEVRDYYVDSPRVHLSRFYSLEYIYKGGIKITPDGRRPIIIQAPAIYWMFLEETEFQALPDLPRSQIWLNVNGPRADRIFASLSGLTSINHISPNDPGVCHELFRELRDLFQDNPYQNQISMVVLLERIIGELLESPRYPASGFLHAGVRIIQELAREIRETPCLEWNFKDEAKRRGISYSSLRGHFRNVFGLPIYEYLLQNRINFAASLLRKQEITIKETAERCGFEDLSSFSRLFKKKIGVAPREYVKTLRQ